MSDQQDQPRKRVRLSPSAASLHDTPTTTDPVPASSTEPSTALAQPIAPDDMANPGELEKEVRAGITEYVCPNNLGFIGILKQRYSDFLVNEILPSGKVVHLRTIGLDRQPTKPNVVKQEEKVAEAPAAKAEEPEKFIEAAPSNPEPTEKAAEAPTAKPEEPEKAIEAASDPQATEKVEGGTENGEQKVQETVEISESDKESLHSIFGEKVTKDLLGLMTAVVRHPDRKARDFRSVISDPIPDKSDRTKAHECLRRIFPNKLESNTGDDDTISIKPLPPKDRGQKRKREEGGGREGRGDPRRSGKRTWEELGGEYLHFTLYKENKDTMEVVNFLGSKTKSGPRNFGFAGTKDRRGVTVQRISAKRLHAESLAGLGRQLRQAAIGDFEYQWQPLELGDLAGNEFLITLRDCHFESESGLDISQRLELANKVLTKAVKDFSEKGFINYFGLQRFGSFATSTDAIGMKMLQEDLAGAISDILSFSPIALAAATSPEDFEAANPTLLISRDDKARAQALNIWKTTNNADEALKILPRKFSGETNIIRHLGFKNRKTGQMDRINDHQGALNQIPRNLRLMYVHAYQSLVWNVVAGKRWTLYGDKVVAGDLILINEHKEKVVEAEPVEEIDQDGEVIRRPPVEHNASSDDKYERARPLTQEEVESGKYNVFDIVLPLPGYDVEYPKNEIGTFYKEFMGSKVGGGLDPHNMRRKWKDLSLSGGYRKLLEKPLKGVQFEVKSYVKSDEQFVETDLEKLMKEKKGAESNGVAEKNGDADVEMEDANGTADEPEGERKIAVILSMQLGTSQYATMALRELMKAGGVKTFKPEYMGGR